MVTLPERRHLMARAIEAFLDQTHPDRELIVVSDEGAGGRAVADAVAAFGRPEIRTVLVPPGKSLGALRNISVGQATGDIVCQWDDDDLHHPERLSRQLAGLKTASILQDVMMLRGEALYWTNWAATPAGGHPGTLMCRRADMPLYPEIGLGEDLALLQQLPQVDRLAGAPHLYVYVTHGSNSWPSGHHDMLADSLAISTGLLRRRDAELRDGLQAFHLPAGTTVTGSNGPAFTL